MSLLPPENNVQIKQYKIISHQEQAKKDCRKSNRRRGIREVKGVNLTITKGVNPLDRPPMGT